MRFYYREGGATKGPLTIAELLKVPGFNGDTLICPIDAVDSSDWRRSAEHPKLIEAVEAAKAAKEKRAAEKAAKAKKGKTCPECGRVNAADAEYCDRCAAVLYPGGSAAKRRFVALAVGLALAAGLAYVARKRPDLVRSIGGAVFGRTPANGDVRP